MSQKVLYLIIGLLAGLLVREWVVRPADSQTTTVKAQEFRLVDANGRTMAILTKDGRGEPYLRIGRVDDPYVWISSNTRYAAITLSDRTQGGAYIFSDQVSVAKGSNWTLNNAYLTATEDAGGLVTTKKNGSVTGRFPTSSGKLVGDLSSTWGRIKNKLGQEETATPELYFGDNVEAQDRQRDLDTRIEALNQ